MADLENHTLALLREMRAEFRQELATMREEANARFDRIDARLDTMHLNGIKALKGFVGHRSLVERAMASVDEQFSRLEQRVTALEAARP